MQDKVKLSKEQGPPSLPPIEFLGSHEVLQILVVGPNLTLVFCPFYEVPPLLQGSNDGKHLLVVDLIVPFYRGQGPGKEGDWVPLVVIFRLL